MQTKKQSLIESLLNTFSVFVLSMIITMIVLPFYNTDELTWLHSFQITVIFTVVSILRNYIWRRLFNK